MDAGFQAGDVIGGNFDSLLGKLIVTGRDRQEALERSRRALDEFQIEGIATALTFHRAVVRDPEFAPDGASRSGCTRAGSRPSSTTRSRPTPGRRSRSAEPQERESVVVEVGGKRVEVTLPAGLGARWRRRARPPPRKAPKRAAKKAGRAARPGDAVTAPMQGTIVKVAVEEGQQVEAGELRGRAGGHEDGAAAQRPQGRNRHGHHRRGRGHRARAARCCWRSRTDGHSCPRPIGG